MMITTNVFSYNCTLSSLVCVFNYRNIMRTDWQAWCVFLLLCLDLCITQSKREYTANAHFGSSYHSILHHSDFAAFLRHI